MQTIQANGNTVPVSSGTKITTPVSSGMEITTQVEQAAMPAQQQAQAQQGSMSLYYERMRQLQATQQQQ